MATRYLKFLTDAGCGPHSGFAWPLPVQGEDGAWTPGAWVRVEGELVVCERGLHATTPEHAADWLDATCYELQFRRRPRREGNKVVGREARLARRLAWDDRLARHFACDCAERALPLFERAYPGDRRPREAIAVARRYADGRATDDELAAADAAADAAAWDAAWDAAWGAAWAAAAAADPAAAAAAKAAAKAAADAAAWDAWGAAWDATRAAAGDAWDAARGGERAWQTERLLAYLDGALG